jgi:hypothetical protein
MLEKPHLTNSEVPPEFIVGATTALLILYVHICQPIGVYSVLVVVNTMLCCGLLPSSITWVGRVSAFDKEVVQVGHLQ